MRIRKGVLSFMKCLAADNITCKYKTIDCFLQNFHIGYIRFPRILDKRTARTAYAPVVIDYEHPAFFHIILLPFPCTIHIPALSQCAHRPCQPPHRHYLSAAEGSRTWSACEPAEVRRFLSCESSYLICRMKPECIATPCCRRTPQNHTRRCGPSCNTHPGLRACISATND